MTRLCACWCPRSTHERWNCTDYCGRCKCDRYRPVRRFWWQFWRSWPDTVWFTVFDLELLSTRPEETR